MNGRLQVLRGAGAKWTWTKLAKDIHGKTNFWKALSAIAEKRKAVHYVNLQNFTIITYSKNR